MIQELVEFCDASFAPNTKGLPCYGNPIISCTDCLKEIHFNRGSNREYDCMNMCHWYVCQDIYRYVSEMAWQLHDTKLGLRKRIAPLNICSIGCGPCSELIAIEEYRRKNGLTFEYNYTGFDLNNVWSPIQHKVASLTADPTSIKFVNEDVFDYYGHTEDRPDMIIMNYMLSDMLKHGEKTFAEFLNNFFNFVDGLSSCFILINDINLGRNKSEPRYYYDTICDRIKKGCSHGGFDCIKYHFADSQKPYFRFEEKRPMSEVLFKVPEKIAKQYNTNTECHSAQMTIIKKKESTK